MILQVVLRTSSPPCWRMNLPYDIQSHRSTEVRYDCTPKTYHLNTEPQEVWLDVLGPSPPNICWVLVFWVGFWGTNTTSRLVFGSVGEVIVFMVLQCFHMTSFDRGDVLRFVASTTPVPKILWQPVWQTKFPMPGRRLYYIYMGVSKNRGTPKWMVYGGKPYLLMDDLGVPLFLETPIYKYLFFDLPLTQSESPPRWHETVLVGNPIP